MTNEKKTEQMNKEERKNYRKKNGLPFLVGVIGFLLLYTAVSTEDLRDKLTSEESKDLISERTTFLMGAAGMVTMIGAYVWGDKRSKGR